MVPGSEGLRMAEADGIGFRHPCRGANLWGVDSGGVACAELNHRPSSLRDDEAGGGGERALYGW
jgi:hypothetical protein